MTPISQAEANLKVVVLSAQKEGTRFRYVDMRDLSALLTQYDAAVEALRKVAARRPIGEPVTPGLMLCHQMADVADAILTNQGEKADHLQSAADLARARLNRGEGAIHAALLSSKDCDGGRQ